MELGPTFADVPDFTLKNLARCPKHAYDGRLTELVAVSLSLIRLLGGRDRCFHGHGLRAHNDMFGVLDDNYYRSWALSALGSLP